METKRLNKGDKENEWRKQLGFMKESIGMNEGDKEGSFDSILFYLIFNHVKIQLSKFLLQIKTKEDE